MIIAHYAHRLPMDCDIGLIRTKTVERGPVWDTVTELYFKAFLLRESGRYGAIANHFSSLYLWQRDDAFCDWLLRGGYKIVTDLFGRAEIETFFALSAARGRAGNGRTLPAGTDAARPEAVSRPPPLQTGDDRVTSVA